jgi:hypothetical protein
MTSPKGDIPTGGAGSRARGVAQRPLGSPAHGYRASLAEPTFVMVGRPARTGRAGGMEGDARPTRESRPDDA